MARNVRCDFRISIATQIFTSVTLISRIQKKCQNRVLCYNINVNALPEIFKFNFLKNTSSIVTA